MNDFFIFYEVYAIHNPMKTLFVSSVCKIHYYQRSAPSIRNHAQKANMFLTKKQGGKKQKNAMNNFSLNRLRNAKKVRIDQHIFTAKTVNFTLI